jgi:hypothetical protein
MIGVIGIAMNTNTTRAEQVSVYYFTLGLVVIFTTYSATLFAAQWLVTRL